jgi:hypothetical protein
MSPHLDDHPHDDSPRARQDQFLHRRAPEQRMDAAREFTEFLTRLEPGIPSYVHKELALASIAASLKRIADALDGTLARLVAEEPPGGLGR